MKRIHHTGCWPKLLLPPFFRLLLVSLVLTATIGGCNKKQDKGIEKEKKPALTIAINAGEEGKAISRLAKKYPAADVSVVELPYVNLREKLSITLSAERPSYDVVMLDDPWFPELSPHLMGLDSIPQSLLDDFIPASLALGRIPYPSGKIYALPYVGNCQLLFYRKDLLKDAGINAPPNTWKELLNAAKRVRKKDPSIGGYTIRGKVGAPIVSDFLPILWSVGGDIFDDRGNPRKVTINNPMTRRAIEIYIELARLSPAGGQAFDWSEMTTAFTSGKSALQLNWPAAVATVDQAIPRSPDGQRLWGVSLPPSGRPGTPGTSMAGNWLLGVPKGSQKAEDAKKFILWLLDHQEEAAMDGNPPTRRSVYESLSKKNVPILFHYPILREALENSTPRPRTPRWSTVEDIISEQISAAITGRTNAEGAVQQIDKKLKSLFP